MVLYKSAMLDSQAHRSLVVAPIMYLNLHVAVVVFCTCGDVFTYFEEFFDGGLSCKGDVAVLLSRLQ